MNPLKTDSRSNIGINPALANELLIPSGIDIPEGITALGQSFHLKGVIRAEEHLIIEGDVEGEVSVPEHGVAVGQHGNLHSDIFARTITVRGTVTGRLTATERIEILKTGHVEGRLVAPEVVIDEGAYFKGGVDPNLTEAAIAVGRHRFQQKEPRPSE